MDRPKSRLNINVDSLMLMIGKYIHINFSELMEEALDRKIGQFCKEHNTTVEALRKRAFEELS